jgi:S-adenosylmethionine:tRNA ribosyltransferase-isomerase
MHPSQLKISDFSYALPVERIARYPLAERDNSKLLVYAQSNIATDSYRNIHNHLPKGSMLVFNNTKVIHARMLFTTDSGASVEVFCLEPLK